MSVVESHDVDALVERLRVRYPELSEADVRDVAVTAFAALEDARLRQFAFPLVEKLARDACRKRRTFPTPMSLAIIRSG